MGRLNDGFTILYLGVAAGIYFKPEYAIVNSRIVTGLTFLTVIMVSKILYQFVLYPKYFTPLKHIHSPKVCLPAPLN
jgi:hypothetical protein